MLIIIILLLNTQKWGLREVDQEVEVSAVEVAVASEEATEVVVVEDSEEAEEASVGVVDVSSL